MDFTQLGIAGICCVLILAGAKIGWDYLTKQIAELKQQIKDLILAYDLKLKEKDDRINKLIDENRDESRENYADIREIAKNAVSIINKFNENLAIQRDGR